MRVAVDQRREAQLRRIVGPEEEAAVVEADAVDGGHVHELPGGEVEQERVDQPAFLGEAERLVLLLPARILGALPAAEDDGLLPSGDQPANWVQASGSLGKLLGQHPSVRCRRHSRPSPASS